MRKKNSYQYNQMSIIWEANFVFLFKMQRWPWSWDAASIWACFEWFFFVIWSQTGVDIVSFWLGEMVKQEQTLQMEFKLLQRKQTGKLANNYNEWNIKISNRFLFKFEPKGKTHTNICMLFVVTVKLMILYDWGQSNTRIKIAKFYDLCISILM